MARPDRLSSAAKALRALHAAIAVGFLAAIAEVWWSVLTRRRGDRAGVAALALCAEGAMVAANHGDCPLGPLQARAGDPVPLFELVLSPTAARRAVPVLGLITAAGLILLMRRGPRATTAPSHRRGRPG